MNAAENKKASLGGNHSEIDQPSGSASPLILLVGDVSFWKNSNQNFAKDAHIAFADFKDIGSDLLDVLKPDIVLSPLMTPSFDCLELAEKLCQLGFSGSYKIYSEALPNISMVSKELQNICPNLQVEILTASLLAANFTTVRH